MEPQIVFGRKLVGSATVCYYGELNITEIFTAEHHFVKIGLKKSAGRCISKHPELRVRSKVCNRSNDITSWSGPSQLGVFVLLGGVEPSLGVLRRLAAVVALSVLGSFGVQRPGWRLRLGVGPRKDQNSSRPVSLARDQEDCESEPSHALTRSAGDG